jgi:hypothetical protein
MPCRCASGGVDATERKLWLECRPAAHFSWLSEPKFYSIENGEEPDYTAQGFKKMGEAPKDRTAWWLLCRILGLEELTRDFARRPGYS